MTMLSMHRRRKADQQANEQRPREKTIKRAKTRAHVHMRRERVNDGDPSFTQSTRPTLSHSCCWTLRQTSIVVDNNGTVTVIYPLSPLPEHHNATNLDTTR